jgi:hypothetical protein
MGGTKAPTKEDIAHSTPLSKDSTPQEGNLAQSTLMEALAHNVLLCIFIGLKDII